ncbi:MAG: hypothetical protein R2706_03685 [Acidimicrobiales bacterium]
MNQLAVAIEATTIDPTALPEPFRRYSLDRLIELWSQGRPSSADPCAVTVGHTANLIVDAGVVTGWLEPRHTIIADRHLDLAIAIEASSVIRQ